MRFRILSIIIFIWCVSAVPFAVFADDCANNETTGFQWPLTNWETNCNNYWSACNGDYHLGSDSLPSDASIGSAVYAPCNGVIRESQTHGGYGGTVIIECWTGTECVSVILGHMFAENTVYNGTEYLGLQVSVGEEVSTDRVVGYIAPTVETMAVGILTVILASIKTPMPIFRFILAKVLQVGALPAMPRMNAFMMIGIPLTILLPTIPFLALRKQAPV